MNEEESDSSDVILDLNGAEPTKEKMNPARKFCYFLTKNGHSLNFVLLADNMTDTSVAEVSEQIQVLERFRFTIFLLFLPLVFYFRILSDTYGNCFND